MAQIRALVFVAVMSLVAEPARRTLNAIILAGATGVYLSGGFGLWELTDPFIGAAIRFRALRWHRWRCAIVAEARCAKGNICTVPYLCSLAIMPQQNGDRARALSAR